MKRPASVRVCLVQIGQSDSLNSLMCFSVDASDQNRLFYCKCTDKFELFYQYNQETQVLLKPSECKHWLVIQTPLSLLSKQNLELKQDLQLLHFKPIQAFLSAVFHWNPDNSASFPQDISAHESNILGSFCDMNVSAFPYLHYSWVLPLVTLCFLSIIWHPQQVIIHWKHVASRPVKISDVAGEKKPPLNSF